MVRKYAVSLSLAVDCKSTVKLPLYFVLRHEKSYSITFMLSVSIDITYYIQNGSLVLFCCAGWPTGQTHRWHQLRVSWYIIILFPLTEVLSSIMSESWLTWLHTFLWLTGMCLPSLILLLNPLHSISTLAHCSLHTATIWVTVSTPVFAPAPILGPPLRLLP